MSSVERVMEFGARRHPEFSVSTEALGVWCSRLGEVPEPLLAEVFAAAAIACADSSALKWLEAEVRRMARSMVGSDLEDEIVSRVVTLVAVTQPDKPAHILTFSAAGPLLGWVRVIVARTARTLTPARPFDRLDAQLSETLVNSGKAELSVLARRCGPALARALESAVAQLTAKERSLLQLHYYEGVGLEELARSHRVHRATVVRWLSKARQTIGESVRTRLREELAVPVEELDSLIQGLQSELVLELSGDDL